MTCDSQGHVGRLTGQEIRVMNLSAVGMENQTVADKLGVSIFCVKSRLKTIYRKLGTSGRNSRIVLTHFALHEGLPNLFDRPNRNGRTKPL